MQTLLTARNRTALVERAKTAAEEFISLATTIETRRTYRYHERSYETWCAEQRVSPWPAQGSRVLQYGTYLSQRRTRRGELRAANTIRVALQAIRLRNVSEGWQEPLDAAIVRKFLKGLRKRRAARLRHGFSRDAVVDVLRSLGTSAHDVRDHALISILYAGGIAYRTMATFRIETTWFTHEGTVVLRTADAARPEIEIGPGEHIETCPVRSLQRWIALSRRKRGPLFVRTTERFPQEPLGRGSTNRIVKRRFKAAGIIIGACAFALHSGCATELSRADMGTVRSVKFLGFKETRSYGRYADVQSDDYLQSSARSRMKRLHRRKRR